MTANTPATDQHLVRRLLPFVLPHWPIIILVLVLVAGLTALEVGTPYLLKVVIDDHITAGVSDGLFATVLMFVIAVFARGVVTMALSYATSLLGQRSMHDLRARVHAHVLTRSASFFDHTPVGRLLTGITTDVEAISALFSGGGIVTAITDVIILVAIVIAMFFMSVELTLVTLASVVLLVPLFRWASRAMRTRTQDVRARISDLATFVMERLAGATIVQTLGHEESTIREHQRRTTAVRSAAFAASSAGIIPIPVSETLAMISGAIVLWYSGARISTALTVGLVVAFFEYTNRVFAPAQMLAQKLTTMQVALASAERIFGLLDTDDADAPARAGDTTAASDGSGGAALEFRDVRFGYTANTTVLHGVSLIVPPGSTIAVVGATGSGKSTLVRLLARHYQAQAGTIFVGGRDVRDLPVGELRKRITLISQDVFLFSGTIGDNVRLGRPDATDREVADALERVGLRGQLDASTKVVERGANLSHGERQLVAFARALVRDPEVLLLDEATAHVDPETEQLIERALARMFAGRTCLIIAHRLATIQRADRIIVMSQGQIVESGTRDELIALGGMYARLEASGSMAE